MTIEEQLAEAKRREAELQRMLGTEVERANWNAEAGTVNLQSAQRLKLERDQLVDRVKTLEDALRSVIALDFTRDENGNRNLYSGAPKFVEAWLLCEKALAAKEPQ